MPSRRIVPAMRRRLPMPSRSKPLEATEKTSISESTQIIPAPAIWINENRKYFGIGDQWWTKVALMDKEQGQLKQNYKDKNETAPDEEIGLMEKVARLSPNLTLFSEQDVITAASKVLLDPIENILLHLFVNLRIRLRTEKHKHTGRVDVVFEIHRSGTDGNNPKNWIECAVLEYKNTNIIKVEHFMNAQVGKRNKEGKTESRAEMEKQAMRESDNTLLDRNAVPLSKQARKYALRTPYVALFDWDTMALFDFSDTDVRSKEPICPRISFFSEYDVNDAKEGEDNGLTHRMFLLGFLANAIQERATAARLL